MKMPEWTVESRPILYDDVDSGKREDVHVLTLGNKRSSLHILVEIYPPRNEWSQYRIITHGRLCGQYHQADTLEEAKAMVVDLIKEQVDDCWKIVKEYETLL